MGIRVESLGMLPMDTSRISGSHFSTYSTSTSSRQHPTFAQNNVDIACHVCVYWYKTTPIVAVDTGISLQYRMFLARPRGRGSNAGIHLLQYLKKPRSGSRVTNRINPPISKNDLLLNLRHRLKRRIYVDRRGSARDREHRLMRRLLRVCEKRRRLAVK